MVSVQQTWLPISESLATRTVEKWVEALTTHGDDAFPGKGNLNAVDEESRKQKKRIKDLEEENAILQKSHGHLRQGRGLRYLFIKNHSSEFTVKRMCHVLEVSRSSYYDWLSRPLSKHQEWERME